MSDHPADDAPIFCGACLKQLRDCDIAGTEEGDNDCPHCGVDAGFIDEVEWGGRVKAQYDLWDAAVRDGLIKPVAP